MEDAAQRSWFGRNWFWVLPLGCLAPVGLCSGLVVLILGLVFGMIKSSTPYTESLTTANANEQVQAALGEPIEPSFFVTGSINTSGSSGDADIAYTISGPKGSATVYAVAEKAAGDWTFTKMEVRVEGSGEQIDLSEAQE